MTTLTRVSTTLNGDDRHQRAAKVHKNKHVPRQQDGMTEAEQYLTPFVKHFIQFSFSDNTKPLNKSGRENFKVVELLSPTFSSNTTQRENTRCSRHRRQTTRSCSTCANSSHPAGKQPFFYLRCCVMDTHSQPNNNKGQKNLKERKWVNLRFHSCSVQKQPAHISTALRTLSARNKQVS